MKYIVLLVTDTTATGATLQREVPLVFPDLFVHKDMADALTQVLRRECPDERQRTIEPLSAGFLHSTSCAEEDACHGQSESMGVSSRGRVDALLITTYDYLHGIQ